MFISQVKRIICEVCDFLLEGSFLDKFREYHKFPFDYNKPILPEAESIMRECCYALEKEGVKYSLGWGTLLGIYRSGKYIPHDTDIDIDIVDCFDFKKIHRIMRSMGMILGRKVTYKKTIFRERVMQQLIYYSKEQVLFDMLFWNTQEGRIIYNYSERNYRLKMKSSFLTNIGYTEFCGKKYPIPLDTEGYLKWIYGEDWRIPKYYKVDWKEDCPILENLSLVKISLLDDLCSVNRDILSTDEILNMDILSKYFGTIPDYPNNFLVDLTIVDPEYYHTTLVALRVMSEILESQPIVLLNNSNMDSKFINLIRSYGITKFIALSDIELSLYTKLKTGIFSLYAFFVSRSKESLLKIKYKGCPIGYYIYDTYLADTGLGTVNIYKFDKHYIDYIYCAVSYFYKYKMIFDEKNYFLFFSSEPSYIGGISSYVAIQKGIKVIVRKGGPTKVSFRLYPNVESLKIYSGHPDTEKYQYLLESKDREAINWSDNYIENLSKGIVDDPDWNISIAYKNSRKLTKNEFFTIFTDGKKYKYIVIIMSHVFNDNVHSYRDSLFVDYETWLRKTLKIVSRRKDVLWLVKPHPAEPFYRLRITAYDIYNRFKRYRNIKFIPLGVSIMPVVDIIDAIVTVRGTATIEYSCQGVPVILAGRSQFDEGGFCIKPKNEKEYKNILLEGDFRRLNESDIEKAKIYLYVMKELSLIDTPFFHNYEGGSGYSDFINHLVKVITQKEDVSVTWTRYKNYLKNLLM